MAGTQSVERTTELVGLIVRAEVPMTYTDLVAATGLPRSTVSRLLGAIERGGLVERDASGAYRGGRLFAEYATRFDRVDELVRVAHAHLVDLADETGETVNLAVAWGAHLAHVDQVDARFVIGSVNWVNVDVPSHCSALGKVMQAWGAVRRPTGRLEIRTPRSISTHADLEAELERTRLRGYALTRGELEEGLDSIAVPVCSADDTVIAALGVSGPTFRIGERRPHIAERLRVHAAGISDELVRRSRH